MNKIAQNCQLFLRVYFPCEVKKKTAFETNEIEMYELLEGRSRPWIGFYFNVYSSIPSVYSEYNAFRSTKVNKDFILSPHNRHTKSALVLLCNFHYVHVHNTRATLQWDSTTAHRHTYAIESSTIRWNKRKGQMMKEVMRCCSNSNGCYISNSCDVIAQNGNLSASVWDKRMQHSEDDRHPLPLSTITQSKQISSEICGYERPNKYSLMHIGYQYHRSIRLNAVMHLVWLVCILMR